MWIFVVAAAFIINGQDSQAMELGGKGLFEIIRTQ